MGVNPVADTSPASCLKVSRMATPFYVARMQGVILKPVPKLFGIGIYT